MLCIFALKANLEPVVVQNGGAAGDHYEYYPPADMPEVYYDDDEQEIIIIADGFAAFYNVAIVSQGTLQTVISTQISGYGDSIDISSLDPNGYTILITSSYNNEFEGQFTKY